MKASVLDSWHYALREEPQWGVNHLDTHAKIPMASLKPQNGVSNVKIRLFLFRTREPLPVDFCRIFIATGINLIP